jgi:CDP-diglyceride synthetase
MSILPGHGGILDRLDGIFAATPVFIVMVFFADLL